MSTAMSTAMGKKILLVDDSSTILMMEKMILRKGHYQLVTAGDGAEAVEKARVERPDLILLDLVMPKVDGFEACSRLRSDASTRDIPVIMVTTRGEAGNMEQALGLGANDFVTKPINGQELLAKIRSYLGE